MIDTRERWESSLSYYIPYFDLVEKSLTLTNIKMTMYIP